VKLIFLDIDGVLNSAATFQALAEGHGCHANGFRAMCPEMVARANRLIRESGAHVVVSSSWRGTVTSTGQILRNNGLKCRVIGCTPRLGREVVIDDKVYLEGERGHEIQAWLDWYRRPVESLVILDDGDDMAHLKDRLVQTDWAVGLQDADVERALALLA
jgi:hypothetical protein